MKKYFFAIMLFIIYNQSYGQSVQAFLFCNTNDPEIRDGARVNFHNFSELTEQIADALGYPLVRHHIIGSEFKNNVVEQMIRTAQISTRDIVIVYISTHGAKTEKDKDLFPIISVPNAYMSSFGIYSELAKKNPKTLITIVEACSGYKKLNDKQIVFLYKQSMTAAYPAPDPSVAATAATRRNNIGRLFSNGCRFIVCAGQPGFDTYATSQGSIFSNNFLFAFNEAMAIDPDKTLGWEDILKKSHQYTFDETRFMDLKHYPVWSNPKCSRPVSQSIEEDSTDVSNTEPVIEELLTIIPTGPKRKSIFSGKRFYDISLQIKNPADVDSITYFLHHTFKDSIVTVKNKYKLINVWGEFPIKAVLHRSDGSHVQTYAEIRFPANTDNYHRKMR